MIVNGSVHHNGRAVRLDAAIAPMSNVKSGHWAGCFPGIKLVVDIGLALFLLLLSAPVILLACLAVKLTSRGPAFYCQIRLGRDGKPFTLYKIRTMTHECERHSGARWATPNDARVTKVGRFLRRTHIDELPQLWNVLRAEMSLVGPRPERPEFVRELIHAIPRYRERLAVRPGITGLAQVQLPPDSDLGSVRRKLVYDVYYVENLSFLLDCRVLGGTAAYLVGMPCCVAQRWFGIPHGETVQRHFSHPLPEASHVPELNPV